MDKPTNEAKQLKKALSLYVPNENEYQFAGWQLAYLLDPLQHKRFVLVWRGYKEGMNARGY